MNKSDSYYKKFALVREMLETADMIRQLNVAGICAWPLANERIFFTGEGSSRIFPAKNSIANALRLGYRQSFATEGGEQACEYRLDDYSVFAASNSGRTAEIVKLTSQLMAAGHGATTAVVGEAESLIGRAANYTYQLICGSEVAVAATKSVVEQALFYDLLFRSRNQQSLPDLSLLSRQFDSVLHKKIAAEILNVCKKGATLYFAGRNDGVAEELTLKSYEITRRRAGFLEGTLALHGIEEVMRAEDVLILIEPFAEQEEKFRSILKEAVGIQIVAIATRTTSFPTFVVPEYRDFNSYLLLAAGWNLLVEIGLADKIDIDRPERTRKVGNEFVVA